MIFYNKIKVGSHRAVHQEQVPWCLFLPPTVKNFHGIYILFMKVFVFCANALFLMTCNLKKKKISSKSSAKNNGICALNNIA